jgi:hypothetical protein
MLRPSAPICLNADPDPAFQVNPDPDPGFLLTGERELDHWAHQLKVPHVETSVSDLYSFDTGDPDPAF